jgi:hypothetical protein
MDYKQQLKKTKEIEKREDKIQQSRDDASILLHLKTLNDELSKLSVVPLPALPSINYSHKKVTDSDIDTIIIINRHSSYCYHGNVIYISPQTPYIYIIQS